jgi:hypothetical protein
VLHCGVTGPSPPSGAASSSGFDVYAVSVLNVLRGAKKFLEGATSTGRSCGRASEGHGFSFWTAPISAYFNAFPATRLN